MGEPVKETGGTDTVVDKDGPEESPNRESKPSLLVSDPSPASPTPHPEVPPLPGIGWS